MTKPMRLLLWTSRLHKRSCQSSTFVVSQFGSKLNVKSEQGEVGTGEVTSNSSAPSIRSRGRCSVYDRFCLIYRDVDAGLDRHGPDAGRWHSPRSIKPHAAVGRIDRYGGG
jgi:hypothetical protein